ncbi:MAG: cation-translocating P-type ATPase [Oscillospiraceae bacterium]|nr:cation-translocating P-type ATPase [Oscillospiraceae bacterium]
MKYVDKPLETVYDDLGTSSENGLTEAQAGVRQAEYGPNKFKEANKETVFQKIFGHMKDFTTLILLAAGIVALYSALSGDGGKGPTDAVVIFLIVALNIFLAVKQEMGAEKSLEALKKMTAQMTVVVRNGAHQTIEADQLVPGDIVLLSAGDAVPADCRLIESINLQVDESMLTGESVPAEKDANAQVKEDASVGDRFNSVHSGCTVTKGRAKAVVFATGMNTEMGHIAELLNDTMKVRTPLQRKMDKLCKFICVLALASGTLLFILQTFADVELSYRLLNSVSLAVAAIPESLPVIMTITLAYGITTMAQKKAIIRKMPAVEALGSAQVICSDKTGTLTMNQMTVQRLWAAGNDPVAACANLNDDENKIVKYMALCNNANIGIVAGETQEVGDPTELGLIRLMRQKGFIPDELAHGYPRVHELPFDSGRKLMTTVHKMYTGKYLSITKGAFDRIPCDRATDIFAEAQIHHDDWSGRSLRVLAVGYKIYDQLPQRPDAEELENNITFLGIVGMIDPPRPESAEAVRVAKEAGIRVVMITGDHAGTAKAIAEDIGIYEEGDRIVTGAQLGSMTQKELEADVESCSVFARVSPEDKISIVQAWQHRGAVVAMTGDGVNDAPALQAADIGVAMGSGTDVSKKAGDMILTDDNFASIVSAVSEGRRVYDNICKVLISLIPSNISEVVAMILGFVLWGATPFAAIQLLFLNVVADGIPDLCMCKEAIEPGAMKRRPIPKDAGVFAHGMGWRVLLMGVWFTILAMTAYYIGSHVSVAGLAPSHEAGRTMAYVSLAWASVVNIMNVRSFKESIFKIGFASNPLLFGGICLSLTLVAVTAAVPGIREVFHNVPLTGTHWAVMACMALTPFVMMETIKIFVRRNSKT